MHNLRFLRENYTSFEQKLIDVISYVDRVLFLDCIIKRNTVRIQYLKQKKNQIFKKKLFNIELCVIKQKIKFLQAKQKKTTNKLCLFLSMIPNLPQNDNFNINKILKFFSIPKKFNFKVKSHYELGKKLGLMDFETAVKISGSKFVILKKDLVKLERALVEFMINIHVKIFGYVEISTPFLVLEETMFKTGQLPKFNTESFQASKYRLIPTSEVPVVSLHSNTVALEHELPIRYVCYSQCFRSESGNNDFEGMFRQKQFSKVELVSIVEPKKSEYELERLVSAAELILQKLMLPYRISLLSVLDTGFCSCKTYDIEVWLPHQSQYREISSCSNCGSFQARRMKTKYKCFQSGNNFFVHTLNGSGLAIGRTIIAILENYQNFDGSISIPQKLQPFMQYQKFITKL